MAAYSTSLLHPAAPGTGPVAFFPAELCSAAPFVLPLCCPFLPQYLYPPPPLPPSCGLVVGCDGWLAPMGSAYTVGVPALPFLPWLHMPPPPPFPMALYYNPALKPPLPATRCSITEIVEDGDVEPPTAEVEDGPSPRSVLAVWRRSAALPPPSSGVAGSKPAFDGRSKKTSVMICNIPNSFLLVLPAFLLSWFNLAEVLDCTDVLDCCFSIASSLFFLPSKETEVDGHLGPALRGGEQASMSPPRRRRRRREVGVRLPIPSNRF